MNFEFDLDRLFPEDLMYIGRDLNPKPVNGLQNASTPSEFYYNKFCTLDGPSRARLGEVLDRMGAASARAQQLQQVITTMDKLRSSDNHIVYIITHKDALQQPGASGDICVGFLKVGRKRLWILDASGRQNEVLPVGVLDFYVHEALQRHGYGKQLFDAMLQNERVRPEHLAIDRPSHKLTSFLAKHYDLRDACPQLNNYVVYPGFFANREEDELFRPYRRTTSGKDSYRVVSMLHQNGAAAGTPAYSRHAHSGAGREAARDGTSPGQQRRQLRNLHDHHQLW